VKAVIPGSFDPFTLGHLDVVSRAARLFGQVIVAVGVNDSKQNLLSMDRRVTLARGAVAHLPNVSVEVMPGLLADFCREQMAAVVVRGARGGADFEAEWAMAAMNLSLGGIETVILPASTSVGFISSTLVRSVVRAGGDVTPYVPANVSMAIQEEL